MARLDARTVAVAARAQTLKRKVTSLRIAGCLARRASRTGPQTCAASALSSATGHSSCRFKASLAEAEHCPSLRRFARFAAAPNSSDIEAEVDHVAVAHDVVATFDAELAR